MVQEMQVLLVALTLGTFVGTLFAGIATRHRSRG
jgi:hypothetical protein